MRFVYAFIFSAWLNSGALAFADVTEVSEARLCGHPKNSVAAAITSFQDETQRRMNTLVAEQNPSFELGCTAEIGKIFVQQTRNSLRPEKWKYYACSTVAISRSVPVKRDHSGR